MAPRPFWNGYLKLSLVTCPVAMVPAVSEGQRVRFRTLDRATGHPVQSRYVDAVTGKPVEEDDEVKGYQTGDDAYVILEDDELEAAALDSTHTIAIDMFVPESSIPWIWHDRPHYLVPTDAVGEEAFAVIREAMKATGTVGISRLVLYRRERAVMLVPRGAGIVLWTLRYGNEVRDEKACFADIEAAKPDRKTLGLMTRLIDQRAKPWDPKMVEDPVQDRLLEIIASRKKGKKRPAKVREEPERPSNVVNIMDALRKSLAADKGGSGRGRS
jgi:DNA end-binding protein Ku